MMKKSTFTYLTLAGWLLLLIGVAACQDDELFNARPSGNGVDWNHIVEVTLPVKTSQAIRTDIVTRAGETTDTDSQIKDILVFVYEIKRLPDGSLDLPNCKRVTFQYFSRSGSGSDFGSDTGGGWIPDPNHPDQGKIKFYAPTGEVYIYLIANSTESLIDFFPGVTNIGETGENDELSTLEKCWKNGIPTWKETLFSTDGYLPMVGLVNNASGECTITDDGHIQFVKDDGQTTVTMGTSADERDNYFHLQRLVSKVSVKIKSKEGVTFTPKEYCFRHVSKYVSPIISSWSDEQKRSLPTQDTPYYTFSTQEPNSFTAYLPENVKQCPQALTSYAQRDEVWKLSNGHNALETEDHTADGIPSYDWSADSNKDDHAGHYHFKNAPRNSTYLEIKGRYEGPIEGSTETVSADTKYYVHLGDFSNSQWQNFCVERDHYYNYTITVNGVNSIQAEVTTEQGETQPGAEGIIFQGGTRLMLDAHYEQVEMKIDKNWVSGGTFIYADTPYGQVSGVYYAKTFTNTDGSQPVEAGKFYPQGPSDAQSVDDVKALTRWISFRMEGNGLLGGTLAAYETGQVKNVIEMLDEFYATTASYAYYTCFVDEYYYTQRPVLTDGPNKYTTLELKQFINTVDRTFGLSNKLDYSDDLQSAVAHNKLLIQQRSIACIYDMDNRTLPKYGIESIDEATDLNGDGTGEAKLPYGNPHTASSTGIAHGLSNTWQELTGNHSSTSIDIRDMVDKTQNGWFWQEDAQGNSLPPTRGQGLKSGYLYGHYSCLLRNRDFDNDGTLNADELRWYTPTRDQLIGVWIGEDAMPRDAALYTFDTSDLPESGQGTCQQAIYSSSSGGNRAIWAEQGCAFGSVNSSSGTDEGMVFAVRNLGAYTPSADAHQTAAGTFYTWNPDDRTITVYLTGNALRPFTNQELAPHHERSEINRPYSKFKVAKGVYTVHETRTFTCDKYHLGGGNRTETETADWMQISTPEAAMGSNGNTLASGYREDGDPDLGPQWRLPNQRELALMVLAGAISYQADTYPSGMTHTHPIYSWQFNHVNVFYTRTHFSNSKISGNSNAYTPYGYIYNAEDRQIQMMDSKAFKEAGYWCVKDVK